MRNGVCVGGGGCWGREGLLLEESVLFYTAYVTFNMNKGSSAYMVTEGQINLCLHSYSITRVFIPCVLYVWYTSG